MGNWSNAIRRWCAAIGYAHTRDAGLAEDVAQDTFVAAWHQLRQLRETSRFRFWLCGIARNLAKRRMRRRGREVMDAGRLTEVASPEATPLAHLESRASLRSVGDALAGLPSAYRECLVLVYQQERSVREVAGLLGLSEAAVHQRLSRGRALLTARLAQEVEADLRQLAPRPGFRQRVMALVVMPSGVGAHVKQPNRGDLMLKVSFVVAAAAAMSSGTYALWPKGTDRVDQASGPAAAVGLPTKVAPQPPGATTGRAPLLATLPGVASPAPITGDIWADSTFIEPAVVERTGLTRGISRGPAAAPIVMTVFVDMQCKFCGTMVGTVDQLFDVYPGKLRLVMKQMPLPVHTHAGRAAEGALAANAQGKYWEYHDGVMASQAELSPALLDQVATQIGLDMVKYRQDMDAHRFAADVEADWAVAKEVGAKAVPTFVINGHTVTGMRDIAEFRTMINDLLEE